MPMGTPTSPSLSGPPTVRRAKAPEPASVCSFCQRSFTRRDALKRHWATCKMRLESGSEVPLLPRRGTRGKERKACGRCVQMKRACDRNVPCGTCVRTKHECSYERVNCSSELTQGGFEPYEMAVSNNINRGNGISMADVMTDLTQNPFQWVQCQTLPPPSRFGLDIYDDIWRFTTPLGTYANQATTPEKPVLPFLRRFTESSGITDCYQCGTLTQRRQLLESQTYRYLSLEDRRSLDAPEDVSCPDLRDKTHEIVTMIKKAITRAQGRSKLGIEWSPVMEKSCFEFFSPNNIHKFLILFWSGWYPQTPIIHKPTFRPEANPPGLVASLAVLGACMSPEPGDCVRAMAWLNPVEEAVFSDAILFDNSIVASSNLVGDEATVWDKLKALHAAYFVCIAQNWEGSSEAKRRIRKDRYSHIVSIARTFGLYDLSLATMGPASPTNQKWTKFILLESMIRTATYIYLLDSAFVLFYRLPPRVISLELNTGLVSPEACFQAESAAECFLQLHITTEGKHNQSRLTISSAVRLLCSSQVINMDMFHNLSSFNMFTIVSALCCLVFQYQTTLVDVTQLSPAAIGLSRWIWLWRRGCGTMISYNTEGIPIQDLWKRIGFMQYADEYYHLACAMLERWKLRESEIEASLAVWATPLGRVQGIPKFDDGEMAQVKALINDVENTSY